MRPGNKRYGHSSEGKRISPVFPNHSKDKYDINKPINFYKDGAGELNYDPSLGWLFPPPWADGKPMSSEDYKSSANEKCSTNFLKKSNGLPGGRL